jgi:hypothetical protein
MMFVFQCDLDVSDYCSRKKQSGHDATKSKVPAKPKAMKKTTRKLDKRAKKI